MHHSKTYSIATWLTRGIMVVVILLIVLWAIGFKSLLQYRRMVFGGHESHETVERFYKAASRRDTAAMIDLFSKRLLAKEGREQVMRVISFGVSKNADYDIEMVGTKAEADTVTVELKVSRSYMPAKTFNICLVKEEGEWKITFPL